MPLYLVRWPNLSVSIVKARNKTDLLDKLDEIDDPNQCKIKEYRGPIFINLDMDVKCKPIDDAPDLVEDAAQVFNGPQFIISEDSGDTTSDMEEEIIKFAFPNYNSYLDDYWDRHQDGEDDESSPARKNDELICKNALQKDLTEFEPNVTEEDFDKMLNSWGVYFEKSESHNQ